MNTGQFQQPTGPFQGVGAPAIIPGHTAASSHTLYVGSLDRAVTENVLYEYFSKFGRISNFKVMREKVKGESRGFAFVDFTSARDAEHARNNLNNQRIMNSYIRIMWKGEHKKVDAKANIFVRNIDPKLTQEDVHNQFLRFGGILSTKLSINNRGESNGFAHIQFFQEEDVRKIIGQEIKLGNKNAIIEEFKSRQEREELRNANMKNLYIRNLPADITEDSLRAALSGKGGNIVSVLLKRSDQHNAFFALVAFETHEQANDILEAVQRNDLRLPNQQGDLYISWNKTKAQLKEERERSREQDRETILYLRNIKEDVTKDQLQHAIGEFGLVEWSNLKPFEATEGPNSQVSYKTQFALVKMRDKDAAQSVLRNKNSDIIRALYIEKKPVFLDIAMPKGDRERMKAIQHRRFPAFGFPFMNPRGAFPMPYNAFPPFQMGGFPPQFQMPRMPNQMGGFAPRGGRPGGMGGGRGGRGPHQGTGRGYRGGPGGHGGMGHQVGGPHQHHNQMPQQQVQQQQAPVQQAAPKPAPAQPQQKKKLDVDTVKKNWDNFKALTAEQKRNVLGEFLYPKVEAKIGRDLAPKITGMLVDFEVMTEEEIMQAIENDGVLTQRIKEAQEALEEAD